MEIAALWRLRAVSDEGSIRLLDTVVLELGSGRFVSLSHSQEGPACTVAATRDEVRWATEPELRMGREPGAEEWLDLVEPEDEAIVPPFPLPVRALEGWFGEGRYRDVFALAFGNGVNRLVLMTTDQFDLVCTTVEAALRRAELVAGNTGLRLVQEILRSDREG
ncbi:hypothetical protein [Actinomadura pelletieri]|uniref:hypothetical protein n=1 Tax=Actinomadura pelletieri TaxID=111805 RepID=UPI000EABCA39|nr:hypothetical protein [Actinomadura pelletieri]